jgi:hypothetical protein
MTYKLMEVEAIVNEGCRAAKRADSEGIESQPVIVIAVARVDVDTPEHLSALGTSQWAPVARRQGEKATENAHEKEEYGGI